MFPSFKSVKMRLNIWFLLVALVPLSCAILIIYEQRVTSIKAEAFQRLIAIRDLKVTQANNWLEQKNRDIRMLAAISVVRSLKDETFQPENDAKKTKTLEEVRENLEVTKNTYKDYIEISLISAHTGKIIVSSNQNRDGKDRSQASYFSTPIQTKKSTISGVYYSEIYNMPTIAFSAPVFSVKSNKEIIGILVAKVNLDQSLYQMLLDRPGMGATGETLIVDNDVIALNELRWYDNAPLRLKINAFPAIEASKGKTGIVEIQDYRQKMVLAAYTYIPLTNWGFVAKQDLDEIYGPIKALVKNCLIIVGCAFVLVFIVAAIVSRGIAAPLISMTTIARQLQAGDYSVRNHLDRGDELGSLAKSMDSMAETLTNQMAIHKNVSTILDLIVAAETVPGFATSILEQLTRIIPCETACFHLLDTDNQRYDCIAALGGTARLMEPIDSLKPEGEIGKAILQKKLCVLTNISADTFFQLKTFSGSIVPKEIITLPLLAQGDVVAILSLGSVSGFSQQDIRTLETVWNGLNTCLMGIRATAKTREQAQHLLESNQELEEQKIELQRQSTEVREQNVELELQRQQVEEATQLKSAFLSNMSHELRTPLNSIMALSRVLIMETEDILDNEKRNYLEVIARNGKKLLSLINDILDLSKIESGRMDLDPQSFSINHFLERIKEGFETICEEKGIEFVLNLEPELPLIESDENRVHQILQNLISNAVKFTNEGRVTITATSKESNILISVEDTGIGIDSEDLKYIFSEFRQVDGSSSRSFEGTGLGLAIAMKSAALIDGKIDVESTKSQGSCFKITLPISWQGMKNPLVPRGGSPHHTLQRPDLKTVMIVDDDQYTAQKIANYLKGAQYNTLIASSGKQALEMAKQNDIFAITLDIVMPDIDGWEVIQQLKNNASTSEIPVIIISVSDDQKTGFALGATDFITKPVDQNKLVQTLNNLNPATIKSVMVVDDNPIDRMSISRMLKSESLDVIEAEGGIHCLELIEEELPDVFLLDLMMPDMSGFEVLKKLRGLPQTMTTPILIVTSKILSEQEKQLLKNQMVAVIEKSNMSINSFWLRLQDQLQDLNKSTTPRQITGHTEKKRILIVEDNPDTIIQVKMVLEKSGYEVSTATGGPEALDYVTHTIPDGIILDLMMPEIDGFEVLEKMRNSAETAQIPVLILTAKDLTSNDLKRLSHNNIQQLVQKGDIDLPGLLFKTELMLKNRPNLSIQSTIIQKKTTSSQKDKTVVLPAASQKIDKPLILIIEDNPDNMVTLKAILGNRYNLIEAENGEDGLHMVSTHLPDLVFLDMSLPQMDGYEVVRNIKKDETVKSTPIVALTAHAMKGNREMILTAGCDDYISKPIDPDEIYRCLEKWLSI